MRFTRAAGILMHPTSLPSAYGIGEVGQQAHAFVDLLVEGGQSLWQVLPLGPTGYGDSPYACFSALAGNPMPIDLTQLVELGDLDAADLAQVPDFPEDRVDFGPVISFKLQFCSAPPVPSTTMRRRSSTQHSTASVVKTTTGCMTSRSSWH